MKKMPSVLICLILKTGFIMSEPHNTKYQDNNYPYHDENYSPDDDYKDPHLSKKEFEQIKREHVNFYKKKLACSEIQHMEKNACEKAYQDITRKYKEITGKEFQHPANTMQKFKDFMYNFGYNLTSPSGIKCCFFAFTIHQMKTLLTSKEFAEILEQVVEILKTVRGGYTVWSITKIVSVILGLIYWL